eukprot:GHUV01031026.1.p1 GENE.GHUV01031026.1~~GHUV01031026.1.p1  ORF type:complete len:182 (+),score=10.99 GHUV01031026.1:461-1006(+)
MQQVKEITDLMMLPSVLLPNVSAVLKAPRQTSRSASVTHCGVLPAEYEVPSSIGPSMRMVLLTSATLTAHQATPEAPCQHHPITHVETPLIAHLWVAIGAAGAAESCWTIVIQRRPRKVCHKQNVTPRRRSTIPHRVQEPPSGNTQLSRVCHSGVWVAFCAGGVTDFQRTVLVRCWPGEAI